MHALVQAYTQRLSENGHDNPQRTIEELLSYHLNCKPLEIYAQTTIDESIVETDVNRLLNNEPLQYILGTAHFYGIEFNCDDRALIPRPETEQLGADTGSSSQRMLPTFEDHKPGSFTENEAVASPVEGP